MTKTTWENNGIQFPRLLAEIYGVLSHEQVGSLAENMDLAPHEVCQLFERADAQWQALKDVTDASGFHPGPDTPITTTMPAWVAIVACGALIEEYNAISAEIDESKRTGTNVALDYNQHRLDQPQQLERMQVDTLADALDQATDILAAVLPDPDERVRLIEAYEHPSGWEDDDNMPPGTEGDAVS